MISNFWPAFPITKVCSTLVSCLNLRNACRTTTSSINQLLKMSHWEGSNVNNQPDAAWKNGHWVLSIEMTNAASAGGWLRVKQHYFQTNPTWIRKKQNVKINWNQNLTKQVIFHMHHINTNMKSGVAPQI